MTQFFSEQTSSRLALLRFPLIVGIVFIHAYEDWVVISGQVIGAQSGSFEVDFLRNVISQGIARLSVPILFLFSGYLFVRDGRIAFCDFKKKISVRFNTLLVPLILWNLFTLIIIAVAQFLPATAHYFSGQNTSIHNYTFFDFLSSIFGIGRSPIAHQFWFIRDLIILLLLSPLLILLLRIAPIFFLTVLTLFWVVDPWPLLIPSAEATLFVTLGLYLALNQKNIFELDKYGIYALLFYLVLLVIDALMFGSAIGRYVHTLSVPLGIIATLFLSGVVFKYAPVTSSALISLGGASFFVFAAHEPLLTALRKIAFTLFGPPSPIIILLLYLAIPITLIIALVILYRLLNKFLPRLTDIITGSR